MGKHEAGYARVERDLYPTPAWVVAAFAEHIDLRNEIVWEPACGDGRMSDALKAAGCACVYSTDIADYGYAGQDAVLDFLSEGRPPLPRCDWIITNAPFGPRGKLAEAFLEAGLHWLEVGYADFLALLLPHDFDSAKTRARFFRNCPQFVGKITLTQRVKWFEHSDPIRRKRDPKENTDWFWWARNATRALHPPCILYAPNHNGGR